MQVGAQRGLATVRYAFDKTASRFTVQAFSTGFLAAFGHDPTIAIRDYEGTVEFVPETYEKGFVRVVVETEALEPLDEMKREDRERMIGLMRGQVLEVERFPEVMYESRLVKVNKVGDKLLQASVRGDLTLRGITQDQSLEARVSDMGATLRVSGTFSLRQSDYGIKPVSFAGGTLRLKDELKFNFELIARHNE
jgi:polyisoprenoid-binding protein YceI